MALPRRKGGGQNSLASRLIACNQAGFSFRKPIFELMQAKWASKQAGLRRCATAAWFRLATQFGLLTTTSPDQASCDIRGKTGARRRVPVDPKRGLPTAFQVRLTGLVHAVREARGHRWLAKRVVTPAGLPAFPGLIRTHYRQLEGVGRESAEWDRLVRQQKSNGDCREL